MWIRKAEYDALVQRVDGLEERVEALEARALEGPATEEQRLREKALAAQWADFWAYDGSIRKREDVR